MIKSSIIALSILTGGYGSPAIDISHKTLDVYNQLENCNVKSYSNIPAIEISESVQQELSKLDEESQKKIKSGLCFNLSDKNSKRK